MKLVNILLVVFLSSCGGSNPPPQPPEPDLPPDNGRICEIDEICDCWHKPPGEDWEYLGDCIVDPPIPPDPEPPDPEPPDPEPEPLCTLGTPTAREALAQGMRPTIRVQRTGARSISGTPFARFGRDYYCSEEMNWPEACAEGRFQGPVAREGHPQRLLCEQHFLEAPCPKFKMDSCTGVGGQCPITFDPFVSIGGVNQNHPSNVAAGCSEDYIKDPQGHPLVVEAWWTTAHGKGYIRGSNFDGSVFGVSPFEINQ